MNSKTEEFLNLLLWSAEVLARPTFRNLTDSYESWAYRNGLLKQVSRLERQQLLERDATPWAAATRRNNGRGPGMGGGGSCSSTCPRDKTPSVSDCDATCATKASATCSKACG